MSAMRSALCFFMLSKNLLVSSLLVHTTHETVARGPSTAHVYVRVSILLESASLSDNSLTFLSAACVSVKNVTRFAGVERANQHHWRRASSYLACSAAAFNRILLLVELLDERPPSSSLS